MKLAHVSYVKNKNIKRKIAETDQDKNNINKISSDPLSRGKISTQDPTIETRKIMDTTLPTTITETIGNKRSYDRNQPPLKTLQHFYTNPTSQNENAKTRSQSP